MVKSIKFLLEHITTARPDDWRSLLIQQWQIIVGNLSTRMRLEKIQSDNTLIIGVYDSHWIHELHMLSPTIINTINSKLGYPHIKAIRLRYVQRPARKQAPSHQLNTKKSRELTAQEQQALETIVDPNLKNALKMYLVRCTEEP